MKPVLTALTIAGTDPSGGAGVPVDLQVFRDFGVHGLSAITAVVWQNTQGVRGYRALEAGVLKAQLEAIGEDLPVGGVKIGMVPTEALLEEIAAFLGAFDDGADADGADADGMPVVFDPVMAEGSGVKSLADEGASRWMPGLKRSVGLITPNADEARRLAGDGPETPVELVEELLAQGWRRVLLKGGHLERQGDEVVDWYGDGEGVIELPGYPAVPVDVRGTGCQLSSAIVASRVGGASWVGAVEEARGYLHEKLRGARRVGEGRPIVVR